VTNPDDAESSGVHVPKTLGDRAAELGIEIGLGVGRAQVSGDTNRSEKSVGIAVLAHFVGAAGVSSRDHPWKTRSIFQRQHASITGHDRQVEHKVK
jgi:hypothetical protein